MDTFTDFCSRHFSVKMLVNLDIISFIKFLLNQNFPFLHPYHFMPATCLLSRCVRERTGTSKPFYPFQPKAVLGKNHSSSIFTHFYSRLFWVIFRSLDRFLIQTWSSPPILECVDWQYECSWFQAGKGVLCGAV